MVKKECPRLREQRESEKRITQPRIHLFDDRCVQLAPEAYSLFATAAMGDPVALWDVRSERAVARMDAHARPGGGKLHCGIDFSPCMRWVLYLLHF